MTTPTYGLYTSTRYDPQLLSSPSNTTTNPASAPSPFFLLPYHRDRLILAAQAFGWQPVINQLQGEKGLWKLRHEFDVAVSNHQLQTGDFRTVFKVRAVVSENGDIAIDLTPTPPIVPIEQMFTNARLNPRQLTANPPPNIVRFVLDSQPISPSMFTGYKTTAREHYLDARARCGLGRNYDSADEALLWNERGQVMEASISNVAFWRGGRWVTPSVECGGLRGITKRWLMEKGLWVEGVIEVAGVQKGEWVLGSNGLKGCFIGVVVANPQSRR